MMNGLKIKNLRIRIPQGSGVGVPTRSVPAD